MPVSTCYSNASRTWLELQIRWLKVKGVPQGAVVDFAAALRAIPSGAERLQRLEEDGYKRQPSFAFDPFFTDPARSKALEAARVTLVS